MTTWCPQCGPRVAIDEDGCCASCGATATGTGADEATALLAEVELLRAAVDFAGRWMVDDITPEGMRAYAELISMVDAASVAARGWAVTNREKDERILARIIAAAETSGVPVRRNSGFGLTVVDGGFVPWERARPGTGTGAMCAIGAGVLYRGIDADRFQSWGAADAFAEMHDVSNAYACGVSDGFEDRFGTVSHDESDYYDRPDYARGYAVGEAVRAYAEDCDAG